MFKKSALFLSFCFMAAESFSQQMNLTQEEPTDFMNGNGKIFVVMAVVVVIVTGLFIYLINLDRKISKLEKGNHS
ncbi:CcmD family protein [Parafilimonas sp.]|uniref:CcmD family protein n=1 Tax=Parafilimonas sp. TaxID=1969739 RepID=UPI0039E23071